VSRATTVKIEDAAALTAKVLKAYLPGSGVAPAQLPALVREVRAAFEGREPDPVRDTFPVQAPIGEARRAEEATEKSLPAPAVPVSESIHDNFLISLEDGGRYRSLRRHLMTRYGMTPEEYREKWGLPPDYPMVAPSYSRARSDLAKRIGLGGPKDRARGSTPGGKRRLKAR
jgi:predicted transcriptional regulator